MNRMMQRMIITAFLLAFWGLMIGNIGPARAETPEEFYRGKILTIVTNEPGGPPDLMARTVAPFLAKEIGAKVKVENRKTDEVMNYVYGQGARGSLILGIVTNDSVIGNDILKAPGVQYETDKFNFVADIYPAVRLFQLSPKLPYKTLEALRKAKGLRGGGTSAKGAIAVSTAVMFEILGLDGKIITGFEGKKALTLAMARGEIDCMSTSDSTAARDEKDGYVVNFMATGNKRSAVVPHVPTLSELGVKVSKEMAAVHAFAITGGTTVALPPGVPQERVEYLRKAFQNLNSNKDLQKGMEKLTNNWTPFVSGQDLQQEMVAMKADKEAAAKLDAIFKKYTALR